MRLITATLIRTPAAVGRASTSPDRASAMRTPREPGDKKKVAALLPLGINPAVGDRGKRVRVVGQAVEAEVDGEVEASAAAAFTVAAGELLRSSAPEA